MPTRIVIAGAAGRMGRRVVALSAEDSALRVVGALESSSHPSIGADAGELAGVGRCGVIVSGQAPDEFDVLLDFSSPSGTMECLGLCTARRRPIVIGATGHDERQIQAIRQAGDLIAVLKAANFSVGANVLLRIVEEVARRLDAGYDVEISEAHHRFKVDAPSGTALALVDAVCRGRRENREAPAAQGKAPSGNAFEVVHGRHGQVGARPAGQIGVHSLRLGDTVGEHTVQFGGVGETLSISHGAHSRDAFAAGAIRVAKWIVGKPAGHYGVADALFDSAPAGRTP